MLKWLLGFLLIANLVFLAYIQWGKDLTGDGIEAPAQPPLNEDKILLLKVPASAPKSATATSSASSAATTVELSSTQVATNPAPATPVEVRQPAEARSVSVATIAPAVSRPAVTQQVPVQPAACLQWGEFSGNDLARVTKALALLSLGDKLAQRETEHNGGYWVYLPPLNTRAELDKKIAELKAAGVSDHFVVQEPGPWLNAISLGVFKSEDAARKFLDGLRAKSVRDATLGERFNKLKFTVFEMNKLDNATSRKILALQKQFPDSELKAVPCPK